MVEAAPFFSLEHRRTFLVLSAAIVLAATALRLYQLGGPSLWLDEAISVHDVARQPTLRQAWRANQRFDTNPPLYNMALHLWCRWADNEWWVRLPSAMCGVACVTLVIAIAREVCGRRQALTAGAVAAVAPFQIWYSQEARYYALLMMLSMLLLWTTLCWARYNSRMSLWLACVAGVGLVYTHVFGWLSVAAASASVLMLAWRDRKRLAVWFAAQAVVVFAFVPYLSLFLAKAQANMEHGIAGFGAGFDARRLLYALFTLGVGFGVGPTMEAMRTLSPREAFAPHGFSIGVSMFALLILAIWGMTRVWRDPVLRAMVLPWLVLPVAGLVAASTWGRVAIVPRYLAGAAPVVSLLLALGVVAAKPRWARVGLAGLLFGCCGWSLLQTFFNPAYGKPDWRGLAATVAAQMTADDEIWSTVDLPLRYYSRGMIDPVDVSGPIGKEEGVRLRERLAAIRGRLWLVYERPWAFDPDGSLLALLRDYYGDRTQWEKMDFHGVALYRFGDPTRN